MYEIRIQLLLEPDSTISLAWQPTIENEENEFINF